MKMGINEPRKDGLSPGVKLVGFRRNIDRGSRAGGDNLIASNQDNRILHRRRVRSNDECAAHNGSQLIVMGIGGLVYFFQAAELVGPVNSLIGLNPGRKDQRRKQKYSGEIAPSRGGKQNHKVARGGLHANCAQFKGRANTRPSTYTEECWPYAVVPCMLSFSSQASSGSQLAQRHGRPVGSDTG
jgi:hypothetical protein